MVTLHDIMSVDVRTIGPEATLREAAELLSAEHITGLPVVAADRVVGVISASDLLDFSSDLPGTPTTREEQIEWGGWGEPESWSEGDEPPAAYFAEYWEDAGADVFERMDEPDGPEWNVLEEHTVSEVMTRALVTLPPETPVREAAEYMLRTGVHRILVMADGALAGMVSTTDVVKAVAQYGLAG